MDNVFKQLPQQLREQADQLIEMAHKVEYENYLDTEIWSAEGYLVTPNKHVMEDGTPIHYVHNGQWYFHIEGDQMIIHAPDGFRSAPLPEFQKKRLRDFTPKHLRAWYFEVDSFEAFMQKKRWLEVMDDDIAF